MNIKINIYGQYSLNDKESQIGCENLDPNLQAEKFYLFIENENDFLYKDNNVMKVFPSIEAIALFMVISGFHKKDIDFKISSRLSKHDYEKINEMIE